MIEYIAGREFPKKVIPLIEKAKQSIDIIVFDWRWYPQDPGAPVQLFNQSIIRACRRGVNIRAITNNDEINEVLSSNGIKSKRITSKKLMHCKLMIIDKNIIITGSHNYTQSAFLLNFEFSTIITAEENSFVPCNFFDILYNSN